MLSRPPELDDTLMRIPVVSKQQTGPIVPVSQNKPRYLCYRGSWDEKCGLWDDTIYHVERLVEQYYVARGAYPTVIYLSSHRYLAAQARSYYPRKMTAKRIPYEHCQESVYEIAVG